MPRYAIKPARALSTLYTETDDDRETERRESHRKGLQGSLSDSDGIEPW